MFFHVQLLTGGRLPKRATKVVEGVELATDSVGYDLFAPEDGFIDALQRKLVKLAFCSEFTPGYVAKIFDRSGMGNKGITAFAGVIDPDYRGEWGIILYNSTHSTFRWKAGDRLGQVVFFKVELPEVCEVSSLTDTVRGVGGYGSTGQ